MIAFLDGVVTEIREGSLILQAGPFGLEVFAPKATLMGCEVGAALRLHTHLAVREEQFVLYGFHHRDLLTLFGYLTSVSGVGPKLALAILSTLRSTLIAGAIVNEDPGLLSSTPGVGKRIAERIVLELKTRLPEELMAEAGTVRPTSILNEAAEDAVQALLALGYRESQVKASVAELALANPDDGAEALIRKVLGKLR
jgi:Holliday junction DNA helicase RuvA